MNLNKPKNNKSGNIGISWDKERKKWLSQLKYKDKNVHFIRFKSKQKAILARKKAEKKYFGEFAPRRK